MTNFIDKLTAILRLLDEVNSIYVRDRDIREQIISEVGQTLPANNRQPVGTGSSSILVSN